MGHKCKKEMSRLFLACVTIKINITYYMKMVLHYGHL